MTKKRFTYEYDEHDGNLFDNRMNTFYRIEDSDENIEILCDRLNWLVDENEELKNILRDITLQLDANHTMQTYLMTIPLNKVIYNELKRRLKKSLFSEDLRSFLDD